MKNMVRGRKGQGTTEYIVILAIAVLIAVTVLWPMLRDKLNPKITEIGTNITNAGR